MSPRFLKLCLLAILLTIVAQPAALALERHGDLPLGTQWQCFRLDEKARKQSGLDAERLAVLFLEPDAKWYTYSHEPKGLGKPTTLKANQGGAPLPVLYPLGTPKPDPVDPAAQVLAYPERTPLFVPLPGKAAKPLTATLELLLCTTDKCLPAKLNLSYTPPPGPLPEASAQPWWQRLLTAAAAQPAARPALQADSAPQALQEPATAPTEGWQHLKPRYFQPELEVRSLFKAVLLGLLAGFILNFMPCVLPVISIKLSAFMAGSTAATMDMRRARFREHNLFFALGILLYFFALSAILGATGLAWGQIFQKPAIVLVLTLLIFALSLSLFGVFSLPIVDLKFDRMTTHPKLQALFTGLLATLLATPCSGPFLGGVLGWTLMQPPWIISSVLAAIGLGMASPYLVMVLFPGLVRLFPKPGAWTGHLEKIVGLLLLGTCVYLLGILPAARLIPALVALWLTAVAAWLWGIAGPGFDSRRNAVPKLLAICALAAGIFWALRPTQTVAHMEPYAYAPLRELLGRQTVVVDFTADWCPSCKVLEQTTLTPARLGDMKTRYGLALMRADLTEKNPEAEALLQALGSQSIPVLAIFTKNAPESPLVLRDLFTPAQFEEALQSTTRP